MAKLNVVISPKYQLILDDVKSIAIGALIMASGTAATSILEYLAKQDFGSFWTPITSVVCAVLINSIRKLVTKKKYVK